MQRILITGGAGFIGSNFIRYLLEKRSAPLALVNLDLLTYAGNPQNLADIQGDTRYTFIQGDIRDAALIERLFSEYQFDTVVNFAAESHVDRSISQPQVFLSTNVLGAHTLLETARRFWSSAPEDPHCREYREGVRFLQISTDEVYGSLGASGYFTENSPLAPSSPYSASKASADLLVLAYHTTYGMPVNITRCSNNYGPYQFPEKLIPLMIERALQNKPLPIYGSGQQVRDWIYVEDHCRAIEAVLMNGNAGEIYNVGASSECPNLQIVRLILKQLGRPLSLITHVADRPGHDFRYAIDSGKLSSQLGWHPLVSFEEGLSHTIQWYLEHMDWVKNASLRQ